MEQENGLACDSEFMKEGQGGRPVRDAAMSDDVKRNVRSCLISGRREVNALFESDRY